MESLRRPLHFVASSLKDLRGVPEPVQDVFGSALLDAQYGDRPEGARPFGEGLPRNIWKLVEDFDGDTFRAAYTAVFPRAVYVLHVFKKKARSGIATPRPDVDRIRHRFTIAQAHYRRTYADEPQPSLKNKGGGAQ
jgi:phage-related protein